MKEEYSAVLNQVSFKYRRMTGDGRSIEYHGCGGRRASLRQYRRELEAAGFEVLRAERDRNTNQRFAIILATTRVGASPSGAGKVTPVGLRTTDNSETWA